MQNNRLKEIMFDQKEAFNNKKNLIDRDINLEKYMTTAQVVVIAGVRRCGKSSLLYLIKEKMQLAENDYCYFNFDDERIIPDASILQNIYNLHIQVYGNEPVFFLDEIQNVNNWEKFVNRVYEQGIKLFVTGSNAKLLSSEISSSLTGRNRLIELFPFSFAEYLRLKQHSFTPGKMASKTKALLINQFNRFVEFGGFPLVIKENDTELINAYFQDILYRDIIARYRLAQVNEIKQIGLFFAANTGKLFSYATLQKIAGIKSLSSIKDYLYYYEQSYLFFYLKKFDFSVKKQIMNPKKVYTIDQAFANRIGTNFSENKGRVLENIVFIELLRRRKEIFYYTGKNECDFLVKEGVTITQAIQVCWQIDPVSQQREIKGLTEAMAKFDIPKGFLLTYNNYDHVPDIPKQIMVLPAWEWLLNKEL